MKKGIFLFFFIGIFTAQNCFNGFESNSFTGWNGGVGTHSGNYSITITSTNLNVPNFGIEGAAVGTIQCSSTSVNPTLFEPLPAPGFGQYSARMGSFSAIGGVAEKLTYSFTPSITDTNFLYVYTTYLEAPGHSPANNPFFMIGVLKPNGDTIPGSLYKYVSGTSSTATFVNSFGCSQVYFKGWTIRGVNLSPYAGQPVTLFAVNADCSHLGHFAYSYIDMDCDGVLNVNPSSNLVLNAMSEPNSSYLWNTGATTPTIMIPSPVPNSTYVCKVTLPATYSNHSFYVIYKINDPMGLNPVTFPVQHSVYPNPASQSIHVSYCKKVILRDNLGKILKEVQNEQEKEEIVVPVASLREGLYFVEVESINNSKTFHKILIKN
jgi:hypothetical protein